MRIFYLILITSVILNTSLFGQRDNDWIPFTFGKDLSEYRGGKFRVEAYVKAQTEDTKSNARLWARIDGDGKLLFFDNMKDRLIKTNTWSKYIIEGNIPDNSDTLFYGGICMGFGKCFFDDIFLSLQKKDGVFEKIITPNTDFENKVAFDNWFHPKKEGYIWQLDSIGQYNGKYSLVIDGYERSTLSYGNNKRTGHYADVNGIRLYYEVYGDGEPVVMLHGNSQSIVSFKNQIPEFLKSFKVIVIDSRGQGNSSEDGKRLTYGLMANDVNAFMEFFNLKKANILGWSDGGNIGLILAMNHPDKVGKLAIMGANLYNDETSLKPEVNKEIIEWRNRLLKENKAEMKFKIQLLTLLLNEPQIKPKQLNNISCPTLVMAGSNDLVTQNHTELIAKNISGSKLVIFENGTHYEPDENPFRFNKTVIEFLKEK